MSDLLAVSQYFEAWNTADAAAVFELFAPGGTYSDPTTPAPVSGPALEALVAGFISAFTDLTFELLEVIDGGEGLLAAQWLMIGNHTGQLGPLPPTGRNISLPGVDIIRVYEGKLLSVEGFFDTTTLHRQLGLG